MTHEAQPNTNLPALPPDIADMVEARDKTVTALVDAYETFHATFDRIATMSIAGRFTVKGASYYQSGDISEEFHTAPEAGARWVQHEPTPDGDVASTNMVGTGREAFVYKVTRETDRRCWRALIDTMGLYDLMDKQAKEEFAASMQLTPPEFTVDTAIATVSHLIGGRRHIFLRGLANTFKSLDRRFRSHAGFNIGNRIVIENAFNEWGSWSRYGKEDTIRDVEKIFAELLNEPLIACNQIINMISAVCHARNKPSQFEIEGKYFRAKGFKNGNCHLWFSHKEGLRLVNDALLEWFKPLEGDVDEDAPVYTGRVKPHATPAKNYGAFFTPPELAERVLDMADIGTVRVDDSGVLPRVLEPSAGGGALASVLARKGYTDITCVEIQRVYANELVAQGFKTKQCDFLDMKLPVQLSQMYDLVVMNPPFDRGRDCDHVIHAFGFLKPGGKLVAIMSARAEFGTDHRHRALHALIDRVNHAGYRGAMWNDLPSGSFNSSGTNVETTLLIIRKPKGWTNG